MWVIVLSFYVHQQANDGTPKLVDSAPYSVLRMNALAQRQSD
jgi:hypothetical protein